RDQDRHLQFHPLRPAARAGAHGLAGRHRPRPQAPLGTQNDTSEPVGQELNYSARISLDRDKMQIDGRMVNLSPGMAVTAEIQTGSRAILSYLLSPLLRYQQEVLHEP